MSCEKQFDRILTEARIRLPGAIDDTMKVEMFAVLDEFFRHSHIWQESVLLGVVTTKQKYDIDSNEWVATVNQLMWVENKDKIPVNASMEVTGELYLYSPPAENQTYTVRVALSVADVLDEDGYPQVPQWVITKYREGLKDGLLARMFIQPAKPYFNTDLAKYYNARWRTVLSSAYADSRQQNVFGAQRWKYPQQFATTRGQ